jgi:hypothetical protein
MPDFGTTMNLNTIRLEHEQYTESNAQERLLQLPYVTELPSGPPHLGRDMHWAHTYLTAIENLPPHTEIKQSLLDALSLCFPSLLERKPRVPNYYAPDPRINMRNPLYNAAMNFQLARTTDTVSIRSIHESEKADVALICYTEKENTPVIPIIPLIIPPDTRTQFETFPLLSEMVSARNAIAVRIGIELSRFYMVKPPTKLETISVSYPLSRLLQETEHTHICDLLLQRDETRMPRTFFFSSRDTRHIGRIVAGGAIPFEYQYGQGVNQWDGQAVITQSNPPDSRRIMEEICQQTYECFTMALTPFSKPDRHPQLRQFNRAVKILFFLENLHPASLLNQFRPKN